MVILGEHISCDRIRICKQKIFSLIEKIFLSLQMTLCDFDY